MGWKRLVALATVGLLGWSCAASVPAPTNDLDVGSAPLQCDDTMPRWLRPGEPIERIVTSGGLVRRFRVFVPAADSNQPLPVVLNFHGLGDSSVTHEAMSLFEPVAAEHGFVVVTPDAYGSARAWRIPDAQALFPSVVDDVEFVRVLLQQFRNDLCLDTGRVFATGFSNGAYFASLLACSEPEMLAGFAPVAGVFYPEMGCPLPVSMLVWHDVNDAIVPLNGGNIFGMFEYRGVLEYVDRWVGLADQCERVERNEGEVRRTEVTCAAGVVTELILSDDVGHTWPGGRILGRSAAEVIWEFFESLPAGDQ